MNVCAWSAFERVHCPHTGMKVVQAALRTKSGDVCFVSCPDEAALKRVLSEIGRPNIDPEVYQDAAIAPFGRHKPETNEDVEKREDRKLAQSYTRYWKDQYDLE